MALVDIRGGAGTYPGTVEIILRATRLGLFTAAEARQLIDRVRPPTTTPAMSIQDSGPTVLSEQAGSLPVGPDGTVR